MPVLGSVFVPSRIVADTIAERFIGRRPSCMWVAVWQDNIRYGYFVCLK